MDKLEGEMPAMSRFMDEEIDDLTSEEWELDRDRETVLKRLKDRCVSSLRVRMEHLDARIQELRRYSPSSKKGKLRDGLFQERLGLVYVSRNLDNAFSKFGDDTFNRIQRSTVEESEE
jgi:hypothetical protein